MTNEVDKRTANVLLNVISGARGDTVTLLPSQWLRYFDTKEVPKIKEIRNNDGDITLVQVDKKTAVEYLKRTHGFKTRQELRKEIRDAYNSKV